MDGSSTLDGLANFARQEKSILKELGLVKKEPRVVPKKRTIDNILSFSKSYSSRKSDTIGRIEMILN